MPFWVALLTAALVWYALRYGSNAPVLDEWDLAPRLRQCVRDGTVGAWAFERHNEHRYPAARLLYAALMAATGYDFRSGMVASALLLGAAALVFARAAARARPAWADLIAPALLLNHGASFNVSAWPAQSLGGAAASWSSGTPRPRRSAWRWPGSPPRGGCRCRARRVRSASSRRRA